MDIRTVIIDDEESSVKLLRRLLFKFPQINVVGTANSGAEALAVIKLQNPHLVFLDINMPGQNGFEFLNHFNVKTFELVIASGFDHAMKAFKNNAVDYLLKPFNYEDLIVTIDKVERKLHAVAHPNGVITSMKEDSQSDKLGVPGKDGIVFVKVSDIIRCEGLINYTRIYLRSGEVITCSKTLLDFERHLIPRNFFRIHKSNLINLNYIEGLTRGASPFVIMSDNSTLQVSRRNRELLLHKLSLLT
jgi:two-component system, LytTR family, response regulator